MQHSWVAEMYVIVIIGGFDCYVFEKSCKQHAAGIILQAGSCVELVCVCVREPDATNLVGV